MLPKYEFAYRQTVKSDHCIDLSRFVKIDGIRYMVTYCELLKTDAEIMREDLLMANPDAVRNATDCHGCKVGAEVTAWQNNGSFLDSGWDSTHASVGVRLPRRLTPGEQEWKS